MRVFIAAKITMTACLRQRAARIKQPRTANQSTGNGLRQTVIRTTGIANRGEPTLQGGFEEAA